MHDRIQEMGWHIVRAVSTKLGEHSRVWLFKDVCHVLTRETGMDAVEGIYLDLARQQDGISFNADTFKNMLELRFLYLSYEDAFSYDESSKFHMHLHLSKWISILTCCLPNKWFSEETGCLPSKLQWLTWKGYNLGLLPESFKGEKLVGLEMLDSNIIQLWRGRKNFDKLTFINLSGSIKLRSTPDLEGTPNLKSLILERCLNLEEVHPSLADLKQIVFLNLKSCKKLKSLPSPIQMESLETLILSYCYGLTEFPEISDNMGTLLKLYLDNTSIEKLPESIENLTGLILMNLRRCIHLRNLPGTIGRLSCLRTLDVAYCSTLEKLPNSLAQVQSLEVLFLDKTAITEPPSSIVFLKNLKTLSLNDSEVLMSSLLFTRILDSYNSGSEQPPLLSYGFIKKLYASKCNLSEGEFPGDLSTLFSLEELDLSRNPFKNLPYSICQLPRLKILDVSYCNNLEKLQGLPSSIAILHARECPRLTRFLDFTKYETLWKLSMLSEEGGWENSIDSVLQSLLQGHLITNHQISILVPGHKIPQWFSQQNEGNYMNLQLPSGWCNGNIVGFALCADLNDLANRITIRFDMMEGEMQHLKLTPPKVYFPFRQPLHSTRQVWLGFLSFDYFKLLFPQLEEEDWSTFEGSLCMQMYHDHPYCKNYWSAIRVVYKYDLKGGATIQDSAGALDNSMGRPRLKNHIDDDTDDEDGEAVYNPYGFDIDSLCTAYMKQTGRMGAEVSFCV